VTSNGRSGDYGLCGINPVPSCGRFAAKDKLAPIAYFGSYATQEIQCMHRRYALLLLALAAVVSMTVTSGHGPRHLRDQLPVGS
jgi:hypothetical protein